MVLSPALENNITERRVTFLSNYSNPNIVLGHTFKRARSYQAHDIWMATNLDKRLHFTDEGQSIRLVIAIYKELKVTSWLIRSTTFSCILKAT